jgi:hypothetical protein
MVWFAITHIFSTIISILSIGRLPTLEKDLEILVLRQQLSILQRKANSSIRPSRIEKLTLSVLTVKLKKITNKKTNQLKNVIRIFQPETVLRWHRELVRKKWTYQRGNKGGRPSISKELEKLILKLAQENPRWGYGKIQGALIKLCFQISQSTIRNILDKHGIQPASVRNGSIGWRKLMDHYKDQILACDFFTVETVWLQTIYVLFFIELGSRQVRIAGITANPNEIWITQQARQLVWEIQDQDRPLCFLIHDNDSKFSNAFDAVFESEGIHVIRTPFRAPNANAFAERWVRTVREECLDHILILSTNHSKRVLIEYSHYYNYSRPHQGIEQKTPMLQQFPSEGIIHRRKILGGIINDYYRSPTLVSLSSP